MSQTFCVGSDPTPLLQLGIWQVLAFARLNTQLALALQMCCKAIIFTIVCLHYRIRLQRW